MKLLTLGLVLLGALSVPLLDVKSEILETEAGEQVLIEEIVLEAPLDRVWEAYSTSEGWTAWSAPVAEVDLRVGGTIRTHYDADASIGDPGTNTLHVLAYVPKTLLTLRAEVAENWPDVLKEDADQLCNTVLFDELAPDRTRVRSFGIGYRATPELTQVLEFFAKSNRGLYASLRAYVEDDERRDWD